MRQTQHTATTKSTAYATSADFCRIFLEEMNSLYVLAFLLTADHDKAEQCFVSGIADCGAGTPVFKEWARSWARRTIIQNAIQMMAPRPHRASGAPHAIHAGIRDQVQSRSDVDVARAAVIQLEPFERFVFVMSVLERYSTQECSLLLGCSRHDVSQGRLRALQQTGDFMQFHCKSRRDVGSEATVLHDNYESLVEPTIFLPLRTSG